jgi:hypothetical protein
MNRIPRYQIALIREKSIPWPARKFSGSHSVWEFGKQLTESADREQFWALMLDSKEWSDRGKSCLPRQPLDKYRASS